MSSLIDFELLVSENLLLNSWKHTTTSNHFSETAIPSRLAPAPDVLDQSVRARKRISPQDIGEGISKVWETTKFSSALKRSTTQKTSQGH